MTPQRTAGVPGAAPGRQDGGVAQGGAHPRQGAQQGVQEAEAGAEEED